MTELKYEVLELLKKIGTKISPDEALGLSEDSREIGCYYNNHNGWGETVAHLFRCVLDSDKEPTYLLYLYDSDYSGRSNGEEVEEYYIITTKE